MRVDDLVAFMVERQMIYRRRAKGLPKPWTDDVILQSYRFCNVYREQDTVTQWIADHWREPHEDDHDLWFAMTVARLVNLPDSLRQVGYPVPWDRDRFVAAMDDRRARGKTLFNAAYMRPRPGDGRAQHEFLADDVFTPMWQDRHRLRKIRCGSLAEAHDRLIPYHGIGSFIAGQVIADLKYVPPMRSAKDWWTWAAPGPGSKRGLNRVCDRPVKASWTDDAWFRQLTQLRAEVKSRIRKQLPPMHAQDLQNALCEWDKYERARLNQGRPKACYPGKAA